MKLNRQKPRVPLFLAVLVITGLAACGTTALEQANTLSRDGRHLDALAVLDAAPRGADEVAERRALRARVQQTAALQWLAQAERARAAGRPADALQLLQQLETLDPGNARAAAMRREIDRTERTDQLLAQARTDSAAQRPAAALAALEAVLRDAPSGSHTHAAARALQQQINQANQANQAAAADSLPAALAQAYRRPVTLEFRDAPLRSVFEALTRSHAINVVFDRDVRADARVTLFLRDTPLDEALRVLLATQQLDRKVLNSNTLLIYPATAAKQREHQDLVARTFYLTNTDTKNATALIRTITKTQDLHADERLNAVVVRETPAVVRLIEDLLAAVDLPDAEVTIEVEVLEVGSRKLAELGLQWPDQVSVGVPSLGGAFAPTADLVRGQTLRGRIGNPVLLATLRGSDDNTNTLANPTIRARNREKAQVHVGEKLPVFTTTSVPNAGVAASVTYLDVGIKLDVEPSVQLDNEVVIKVALEVSNLLRQVNGPAGSVGYELGTRRTSTTLRLKDGETQILAGLVKDEDLRNVDGVPGLAKLPLVGRLFGLHTDRRDKTELVLLMTPRVVRNLPLPDARITQRPAGTAMNPGAVALRLADTARVGMPLAAAAVIGAVTGATTANPAPTTALTTAPTTAPTTSAPPAALLELATSGNTAVGEAVSVTLRNRSEVRVSGDWVFDSALLRNAAAGAEASTPVGFDLPPGGQQVLVLRVQPAAAGKTTEVTATPRSSTDAAGANVPVEVVGSGRIEVRDAR
jgi:general secretion pathway protein D